ncbi:MAG: hypothetical protein GY928_02330, partial [Colwellia sp.]|nr:hypothetical protein [Colwellia sp.]
RELIDILSIESVSIIGVLLGVIYVLYTHIKTQKKEFNEERRELKEEVKDARDNLEAEYSSSNKEMQNIIQKYYVLSTKVLDSLKTRL